MAANLQVSNLWVHVAFLYLKGRPKKTGQIFCVRQAYFTKSCQQIWWCVKQPFILFIHLIWGKQYYEALFFYYTEKRMFSHANRPRAEWCLKVFTIFQDQLHSSINIHDDRSTRFLCTTNYKTDHIIKHLHEDNSIISGLFSQNNLLLCSMYKVIMGFYRKRSKNFQNHLPG